MVQRSRVGGVQGGGDNYLVYRERWRRGIIQDVLSKLIEIVGVATCWHVHADQ